MPAARPPTYFYHCFLVTMPRGMPAAFASRSGWARLCRYRPRHVTLELAHASKRTAGRTAAMISVISVIFPSTLHAHKHHTAFRRAAIAGIAMLLGHEVQSAGTGGIAAADFEQCPKAHFRDYISAEESSRISHGFRQQATMILHDTLIFELILRHFIPQQISMLDMARRRSFLRLTGFHGAWYSPGDAAAFASRYRPAPTVSCRLITPASLPLPRELR